MHPHHADCFSFFRHFSSYQYLSAAVGRGVVVGGRGKGGVMEKWLILIRDGEGWLKAALEWSGSWWCLLSDSHAPLPPRVEWGEDAGEEEDADRVRKMWDAPSSSCCSPYVQPFSFTAQFQSNIYIDVYIDFVALLRHSISAHMQAFSRGKTSPQQPRRSLWTAHCISKCTTWPLIS